MKIKLSILNNRFNLDLKENITIIGGNSGTGKTLLVRAVKNDMLIKGIKSEYEIIDKLNTPTEEEFKQKINNLKDKVIVIDNADRYLNKEIIKWINLDSRNRYILMGRAVSGVETPPSGISIMEYDNVKEGFKLRYIFEEEGW